MAEAYEFYINGWQVPITPSELEMSVDSKNDFLNLINGETYTVLHKRELKEFSFSFFSFSHPHPSVGNFISQAQVLKNLEDLKNNKEVFEFVIIRTSSDPELKNSTCRYTTLEDFKVLEDSQYGTNIKISVTLKEYIPIKTVKLVDKTSNEPEAKRQMYKTITENPAAVGIGIALTATCMAMPGAGGKIVNKLLTPLVKKTSKEKIKHDYQKFKQSIHS